MTINNIGEMEFLQEYIEFPYALLALCDFEHSWLR
jgi:hypothetical protein